MIKEAEVVEHILMHLPSEYEFVREKFEDDLNEGKAVKLETVKTKV